MNGIVFSFLTLGQSPHVSNLTCVPVLMSNLTCWNIISLHCPLCCGGFSSSFELLCKCTCKCLSISWSILSFFCASWYMFCLLADACFQCWLYLPYLAYVYEGSPAIWCMCLNLHSYIQVFCLFYCCVLYLSLLTLVRVICFRFFVVRLPFLEKGGGCNGDIYSLTVHVILSYWCFLSYLIWNVLEASGDTQLYM